MLPSIGPTARPKPVRASRGKESTIRLIDLSIARWVKYELARRLVKIFLRLWKETTHHHCFVFVVDSSNRK